MRSAIHWHQVVEAPLSEDCLSGRQARLVRLDLELNRVMRLQIVHALQGTCIARSVKGKILRMGMALLFTHTLKSS
jgi:hypothetical protein